MTISVPFCLELGGEQCLCCFSSRSIDQDGQCLYVFLKTWSTKLWFKYFSTTFFWGTIAHVSLKVLSSLVSNLWNWKPSGRYCSSHYKVALVFLINVGSSTSKHEQTKRDKFSLRNVNAIFKVVQGAQRTTISNSLSVYLFFKNYAQVCTEISK